MSLRNHLRLFIAFSFGLQVASVVSAAFMLWLAIDLFLTGSFFFSAVETAIGFWMFKLFSDTRADRVRLRGMIAQLDELERRLR